jgi:hypothetical protein
MTANNPVNRIGRIEQQNNLDTANRAQTIRVPVSFDRNLCKEANRACECLVSCTRDNLHVGNQGADHVELDDVHILDPE